jgi:hypothetical protein
VPSVETNFLLIEFSKSTHQIEDFNPKSLKIGESVGKVYNFKKGQISK